MTTLEDQYWLSQEARTDAYEYQELETELRSYKSKENHNTKEAAGIT